MHRSVGLSGDNAGMEISDYLSGEKFDDDYGYRPSVTFSRRPRAELLEDWCSGRTVLHVGFADHQPLIASRAASGQWLHARLCRSARACYGVDINADAVDAAKRLGFDHVFTLDIHEQDAADSLQSLPVDLVMVPDVLEHLSNPAAFLKRLAELFPVAEFIISVPNALALRNIAHTLTGMERVNTDHRAWFSPYTLQKVLADAGLRPTQMTGCAVSAPRSVKGRMLSKLMQWRPIGSDVLVARARTGAVLYTEG